MIVLTLRQVDPCSKSRKGEIVQRYTGKPSQNLEEFKSALNVMFYCFQAVPSTV